MNYKYIYSEKQDQHTLFKFINTIKKTEFIHGEAWTYN